METINLWLRGLAAAFIGGGASAVSGAVALNINDPKDFNTTNPDKMFHVAATMFLISGFMAVMAYLKQSPLPPDPPAKP